MAEKKAGGGSKLSRTQTVTVRFDPKLRYLTELAARKQRRTVSSYIEWAVQESLSNLYLQESGGSGRGVTIADEAEGLWDVDDTEKFVRLVLAYPELLTHEEQLLWRVLKDSKLFEFRNLHRTDEANASQKLESLEGECLPFMKEHWSKFIARSQGETVEIPEFEPPLPPWVND